MCRISYLLTLLNDTINSILNFHLRHVSKFCGKANAKPDKECHPHQNHCTGEYVCTKVGIKRNPLDGNDGNRFRSRRRNGGLRRKLRFRRTRSKRQTKKRNRSSFRNER